MSLPLLDAVPVRRKDTSRYEARMRRRTQWRRVALFLPAVLGMTAFVVYTESSDVYLPRFKAWMYRRTEGPRAWWRSTFHDHVRG